MNEPRELDFLISLAKQKELEKHGGEAAQIEAIRILSNAGGALPLSELLERYGVSKPTIAALVDEELHKDKRRKVRARVGEVSGVPVIWLTASGHQAAGKTRGNEVRPTSDSLAHALAPSRLAKWFKEIDPQLKQSGIDVSISWGPSIRTLSDQIISLAWARLKVSADSQGSIGLLTGGVLADCLVITRYSPDEQGVLHFKKHWGIEPASQDQLAECVLAVEYQVSLSQGGDPLLRSKVDAWSAVIEQLGCVFAVIWIVEPAAGRVLSNLGVGDDSRRTRQLLVPAPAVGIGSSAFTIPGPRWWPLDVSRDHDVLDDLFDE